MKLVGKSYSFSSNVSQSVSTSVRTALIAAIDPSEAPKKKSEGRVDPDKSRNISRSFPPTKFTPFPSSLPARKWPNCIPPIFHIELKHHKTSRRKCVSRPQQKNASARRQICFLPAARGRQSVKICLSKVRTTVQTRHDQSDRQHNTVL